MCDGGTLNNYTFLNYLKSTYVVQVEHASDGLIEASKKNAFRLFKLATLPVFSSKNLITQTAIQSEYVVKEANDTLVTLFKVSS